MIWAVDQDQTNCMRLYWQIGHHKMQQPHDRIQIDAAATPKQTCCRSAIHALAPKFLIWKH
eukprot:275605-Pelagomonas_calceolata.AAC.4